MPTRPTKRAATSPVPIVVLLWLAGWMPSGLSLAAGPGRTQTALGTGIIESTGLGRVVSVVLVGSAILASLAYIAGRLRDRVEIVSSNLVLLLAPAFCLVVISSFANGRSPSVFSLAFPFCATALCLAPYEWDPSPIVGRLTVLTATISLGMGAWTDRALMPVNDVNKALVGDRLLAGPYGHSNILGLTLVLGLPFVHRAGIHGRRVRIGVALVALALLWSGSRTAMAAAALALLVYAACRAFHRHQRFARQMSAIALLAGAVLMVAVPLTSHDGSSFTRRGIIWQNALQVVRERQIFGLGSWIFSEEGILVNRLGVSPEHGHNIFITSLAMGGALTVMAVGALLFVISARTVRTVPSRLDLLGFLVALLYGGILETVLDFRAVNGFSFVVWPLVVVLVGQRHLVRPDGPSPDWVELRTGRLTDADGLSVARVSEKRRATI